MSDWKIVPIKITAEMRAKVMEYGGMQAVAYANAVWPTLVDAAPPAPQPEPRAYLWITDVASGVITSKERLERLPSYAVVTPLFTEAPPPQDVLSKAACDVIAERHRQINIKGHTAKFDDLHDGGTLAQAGAGYAAHAANALHPFHQGDAHGQRPDRWPFNRKDFNPSTPRRDLVKAAALMLAEIERLDRAAAKQAGE